MRRGLVHEVHCDDKASTQIADAEQVRISDATAESATARAARLLSLRDAISSGTYQIAAEVVADKVIERMRSQATPKDEVLSSEAGTGPRTRAGRSAVAARRPATDSSGL